MYFLYSFHSIPTGWLGLNNKQSEIVSGIIGNNNSNNSNGIETIFYDLSDSLSSQSKNTVIYKSNISPDVRNQFRYYQISLAKLGENVKVLLQIYYSIRDIRTPYIFKKQPVGKIYALRNGNVNILFNKYEEVGIYAAFQSFKVINNETINLYDGSNDYDTYVKNFTGIYITGENGQFVYVQPLRDNIIRNLNFISTYILPNYFQS
jgi:hypothetical protein